MTKLRIGDYINVNGFLGKLIIIHSNDHGHLKILDSQGKFEYDTELYHLKLASPLQLAKHRINQGKNEIK